MTIEIKKAEMLLSQAIAGIKKYKPIVSTFKLLKTDWGQKELSVSVEKSYAILTTKKGEILKLSLKDLI